MIKPAINTDLLISHGATFKKLNKDEIIFKEGSHCCFYYQLADGEVRWVNIDEEGREFIQNIIEPGESFGELPLFDDNPYAATAIASENSTVLRLSKTAFLQLIKNHPEIHFEFSKLFVERLRFKFMILREIAVHGPEDCITNLFKYFKERKKFTCSKCSKVTLTRQQIADMTGMRVETVIRAIRNLHDQGKLVIEKGKVYC